MYRNQYDTDVTTFSPQGRLHQVEYAMEAVKQGAASVGLRNKEFCIVGSIKRSTSDLASYQQKIFKVDEHLGIAVAGLISDARVLAYYMRNECLNWKYSYDSAMPAIRLVTKVSDKSQSLTHADAKRPYGVGLLVASYDRDGPHLYQTEPSGIFLEWKAQAIGARSQSSKTYLEKVYDQFDSADRNTLIKHVLTALKSASQKKMTSRNVVIGIVGAKTPFTVLEGDDIRPFVAAVNEDENDEDEEEPTSSSTEEKKQEEEKKTSEEKMAEDDTTTQEGTVEDVVEESQ